jgi:hypothetical protein
MCNLCRMNICLILEVTLFPWLILYHLTVREQNYCEECTVLLSFLSQKNLQSKICVIQLFFLCKMSILYMSSAEVVQQFHQHGCNFQHTNPPSTKCAGMFVMSSYMKVPYIVTVLLTIILYQKISMYFVSGGYF